MDWIDRSVLITGGSGFIGSHLACKLLDLGAEVHVLQRASSDMSRLGQLEGRVTVHRCGLTDRKALQQAVQKAKPDHVFHLAAEARANLASTTEACDRSLDDTVRPLIRLVETLADLPSPPQSFVRAGSIAECGISDRLEDETSQENPVTAYGAAMLSGTKYLAVMAPELPFPCLTARLALTYGRGQSERFLIARLVAACIAGREVQLHRPLDRRDVVHVDDVTAAMMLLARSSAIARNPVVNVSSAHAPSMRQIADLIANIAGISPACFPNAPGTAPHDPSTLLMDNRLARQEFGWSPKITLQSGLAKLIADAHMLGKEREVAGVS